MFPKNLHGSLSYYTLSVNESVEMAETMTQRFIEDFNKLDKWDQMELDQVINLDGWEKAFEKIETLL